MFLYVRTTCSNILKPCILPTQSTCVFRLVPEIKQALFP
jgi:hypothetical protein